MNSLICAFARACKLATGLFTLHGGSAGTVPAGLGWPGWNLHLKQGAKNVTDLEIARTIRLRPIRELAGTLGLADGDLLSYGPYKAKINLGVWDRLRLQPEGKLILVTGMTPTPAGEGKTTVSIGLAQALCRLGHKAVAALREPSLGPCMGLKGGATGGGYAQVLPMEDINLHFTGDLHAVSSAHNLLAAMVDNHLHHGNALGLDPRRVSWRRAVDMNDRALRQIVAGLGGRGGGVPREAGFDITAASEVMAILCLASGYRDLVDRLGRIQVGLTFDGRPVTARDLRAAGAMGALLRDALSPNLVQTAENTPALVHGGPFANIAHGCSSLMATRMGLRLADYVVTEAGFGADLGAEKFFNIKCRIGNLQPRAAVLVATVKAVKYQGTSGKAAGEHGEKGQAALRDGFRNLARHIRNVRRFGVPVVVAVNRFPSDEQEDLAQLEALCRELGVEAVPVEVWESGGEGGIALARA
ncbi:MAG: formate--tetrahydrofolate ligase, partial [Firmicutes bacterium]|nr:formate--tetrahydrofolate ligase [Bacillota bacterium]